MSVFVLEKATNFASACKNIAQALACIKEPPPSNAMWCCDLPATNLQEKLSAINGAERIFFHSRDDEYEFVGFGAADRVTSHQGVEALVEKSASLFDEQIYFGGRRFDDAIEGAPEWQSFGKEVYLLPLVFLSRTKKRFCLSVNYREDGHLSFPAWQDRVVSLMHALMHHEAREVSVPSCDAIGYEPAQERYAHNINQALAAFLQSATNRKVVIGRRKTLLLTGACDPCHLFFRLHQKSRGAFLFFLDCGSKAAFFGVSPELLYRRHGRLIETESLAGTRPRAHNEALDDKWRLELLASLKDNQEHALVSLHIEDKLREFGASDLSASKIEIMALPFVQHLLRRYHGTISEAVNDATILGALHPTPAVCGLDIKWARNFIREHEGFDRGFYAGPIGYVGKDRAEFAVAIRSALYEGDRLYVYAACGIVPGSSLSQEWEELNNKEKSILSIFG